MEKKMMNKMVIKIVVLIKNKLENDWISDYYTFRNIKMK